MVRLFNRYVSIQSILFAGTTMLLGGAFVVTALVSSPHPSFFLFFALFLSLTVSPLKSACREVASRMPGQGVLIVGSGQLAALVANHLQRSPFAGFRFLGMVDPTNGETMRLIEKERPEKVIVAMEDRRGHLPTEALLTLKAEGVDVLDALSFYERLTGKISLEHLKPSWLLFGEGFRRGVSIRAAQRSLDLILSTVGLVLSLPLLLFVPLLIRLDSSGPVFYRQERMGRGGRVFQLLKFRTMRPDAEGNGPVWAIEDDPRVTRVGRFLRKWRLDEVPQMINVLRGEMSFVGPRPERPVFVRLLSEKIPYYPLRHSVRPGITGWAQVRYRYGASVEDAAEKLKYDLYYVKNSSLFLDLSILFQTARVVLLAEGSR